VLVLAGLWAALVPFFGPYLHLSIGTASKWHWSTGRLWLDVLPGAVAVLGGLVLLGAVTRGSAALGSWLGIAAGLWLVGGQTVSFLWHHGASQAGAPIGTNFERMLAELVYFYAVGGLILLFGAFALGRLALPATAVPVAEPVGGTTTGRRGFFRRRRAVGPAATDGTADGTADGDGTVVERPVADRPVTEPVMGRPRDPVDRP
jgi:hypothetical protein